MDVGAVTVPSSTDGLCYRVTVTNRVVRESFSSWVCLLRQRGREGQGGPLSRARDTNHASGVPPCLSLDTVGVGAVLVDCHVPSVVGPVPRLPLVPPPFSFGVKSKYFGEG